MAVCLLVNDDLQRTFERIKAIKKGSWPQKFVPGEATQHTMLNPSHIYTLQQPPQQTNQSSQPKP